MSAAQGKLLSTSNSDKMKKYLLNLCFAVLLLYSVILTAFGTSYYIYKRSSYKVDPNRNILVVGNSFTECAVNDNILTNYVNISSSGEHYLFSYAKTKKILDNNPHIDTVLLPVAETVISKSLDSQYLQGTDFVFHFKKYIYYMEREDIPFSMCSPTDYLLGTVRAPFESVFSYVTKSNRNKVDGQYMGGYLPLDKNILPPGNKGIESVKAEIDTTSFQYKYLKKIEKLCNEKGIEFILINTPKYKNQDFFDNKKFDSLRKTVIPEIKYFDFSDFPLADSCYADQKHLNYKGAAIFSEYLRTHGLK